MKPRVSQLDQSGAADGDVLAWDDTAGEWAPSAAGGGGGGGTLDGLTDVDATGAADGDALVYDSASGLWVPGAGGAGGTPASPTLVATAVAFVNNSTSGSITLPATIAAGDGIFLFTGHGFGTTTPTGYAQVDALSGQNVGGAVNYKVAVAGDAGAVQNVSFAGTYYGEIAVAVVRGMSRIRTIGTARASSGSSVTVSGPQAGLGDLALYWGHFRASNTTVSVSRGTVDQQRTADTNAGCVLADETLASGGPITETFTSSVGTTSGYYVALITMSG
jgi:hypothetical protein